MVIFLIWRPMPNVCLRYCKMHLTTVQWSLVGARKYWPTLFMANDKSGRVSVRYCRASTMLQYLVASSELRVVPSCATNFVLVKRGVRTFLHCSMPAQAKMLEAYFSCDCNTLSATIAATVYLQFLYSVLQCLLQYKPNSSWIQIQIWALLGFSYLSHIFHL
jgi:hypothetical protein